MVQDATSFAPISPLRRFALPPAALTVALAAAAAAFVLLAPLRAPRRREAELRLRLQEATVELEQVNARMEEMATRDELTGVRNRRYFLEQLDLEWRRAMRTREPVSLVVADIDAFRALNDTYGDPEGDSSLARVAACMRAAARRSSDCVARIGGEEFAILLPGTGAEGAVTFAERVRHDVESLRIPNVHSRVCPTLTISVGVSTTRPRAAEESPGLVATADRGLSQSKAAGCNRVTYQEWSAPPVTASGQG
jgi:diguanylate cyclase (GGDEF)-like protein